MDKHPSDANISRTQPDVLLFNQVLMAASLQVLHVRWSVGLLVHSWNDLLSLGYLIIVTLIRKM